MKSKALPLIQPGHLSNPGNRPSAARARWSRLWDWVPIRALSPRHRARIAAHLRDLPSHDRYLRFGYPASDTQIQRYVDALDFERDEVFGIFGADLSLVAVAHLAYAPQPQRPGAPAMVEFGVSVDPAGRGRHYGSRLFARAMLQARNRGAGQLFIHALSENTAMLKIARNAGATIERDGSDAEAWITLPKDTLATQVGEALEQHAAEMHYQVQVQVHRATTVVSAIEDTRALLDRHRPKGHLASE